jgi:hypothetical protein
VLVWLAVVLVVAAIGWWNWSRRTAATDVRSRGSSSRLNRTDVPARTGVSPRVTVTLRVNFERRVEVTPATPLFFDVTLTTTSDEAVSIGDAGRAWASRLRLVRAGSSEPLPWTASLIDAPTLVTASAPTGQNLSVTVQGGAAATLRSGRTARATWAVSPQAVTLSTAGTYRIEAQLDVPTGGTPLVSQPVTVVVVSGDPRAANDVRDHARLKLTTLYDLATKLPEDARRAAEALVASDPRSADAQMVLGDALAALGREGEAMTAYRQALSLSPATYEPPGVIYERIARLSKRGGGK